MSNHIRSSLRFATALGLLAFATTAAGAQQTFSRAHASRAELERAAAAATPTAANLIQERLRAGDFMPGDRIVLRVQNDSALTDTFTVRAGRVLTLPGLADMPLTGLLRSELEPALLQHLSRNYRDPQIQVLPLVRIAVMGQVQRPGFYALPSDALVSDAIMLAGGPTVQSDMQKAVMRRSGREILSPKVLRDAISRGSTLDQLDLRAGDEIFVAERPERDMQRMISTFAVVMTAVTAYLSLRGS